MIKVRNKSTLTNLLDSDSVNGTCQQIEKSISENVVPTFPSHWKDIREELWKHQQRKCCFCERMIHVKFESDVEHFRPKGKVSEDENHPGYYWLAYETGNLFVSCNTCNRTHKGSHFPIQIDGTRAYSKSDSLVDEHSVLIDPVLEDPEEFICFDWTSGNQPMVKCVGRDPLDRGHQSIKILGLNRDDLLIERGSILMTLEAVATKMKAGLYFDRQNIIDATASEIFTLTASNQQFASFKRDYFRKNSLGEYIQTS